MVFSYR